MATNCAACFKALEDHICISEQKYYHKSCCSFCKHTWVQPQQQRRRSRAAVTKILSPDEKTPPMSPPIERSPTPPPPPKATKTKAAPGRLNFNALGNFVDDSVVKCYTCKKVINGQKYLAAKIGEYNCHECHTSKNASKCSMCQKLFEAKEVLYSADEDGGQKYCSTCIEIYYLEKAQARSRSGSRASISHSLSFNTNGVSLLEKLMNDQNNKIDEESTDTNPPKETKPRNGVKPKAAAKIETTTKSLSHFDQDEDETQESKISCGNCSKPIKSGQRFLSFANQSFHDECFTCSTCHGNLSGQKFFKQPNGKIVCEKCKEMEKPKCGTCNKSFESGEQFYKDTTEKGEEKKYCLDCFTKAKAKKCFKCSNIIQLNQPNLVFDNKTFHKDCFTCGKCDKKINPSEKFFKDKDNNLIVCSLCR